MATFFQTVIDRIFGRPPPQDVLPDDGGLAEFAKQYAAQLAEEAKHGKKPGVAAEDVLYVQQGRHGARAYLLDTTDFKNAIVKELRLSITPVTEGILKKTCGEKGTGFMNVEALYAFHIHKQDALEEYNAAVDIIDEIGERLLGERYITGERRIQVPVADVQVDDLFNPNGTFDLKKAKKAIKLVRDSKVHGPASIDWENGKTQLKKPQAEWVENRVTKSQKDKKDWQVQTVAAKDKTDGQWQEITRNAPPAPSFSQISQPQQGNAATTQKAWLQNDERPKAVGTTAQEWITTNPPPPPPPITPNKELGVQPTTLRQLGEVTLAFHPTWQAEGETINTYAGFAFRQQDGTLYKGDLLYPDAQEVKSILRIDKAIAKQAVQHLERSSQLDHKTVILPFHQESLLLNDSRSPIKILWELPDETRARIWLEVVGITSASSPGKIAQLIQSHQDKFSQIGLRLELGDLSRGLLERTKLSFVSCERESAGLQLRHFAEELHTLAQLAQQAKIPLCLWGAQSREEITTALQERCALINGRALARDMRTIGKIIPLKASKLLTGL